ncbi:MAG TPA: cupredoxin domain-containing protein [Nitrospiria bacterium]
MRRIFPIALFVLIFGLAGVTEAPAELIRELRLEAGGEEGGGIWNPLVLEAVKGETIRITLVNPTEVMHGFNIKKFKIREQIFGESERVITFKAKKSGTFKFFCHFHKKHQPGKLIVINE